VTAEPAPSARTTLPTPSDSPGRLDDQDRIVGCDNSTNERRVARRRGDTLLNAIYDAVLTEMSVHGFSGLTMEGVASCARTGKAALYRRWSCKEDLAVEALNQVLPCVGSPPDSGDLRTDLATVLHMMRKSVNSPAGCVILGVMAELDRDHEFVKTINERVLRPRKSTILAILEGAAARGEISADRVSTLVAETPNALVMTRVLCDGPPVSARLIDEILDDVMMPLVCSGASATRV
jgi:AcrR family transcriptional regulator